jgi:hypothetical protein
MPVMSASLCFSFMLYAPVCASAPCYVPKLVHQLYVICPSLCFSSMLCAPACASALCYMPQFVLQLHVICPSLCFSFMIYDPVCASALCYMPQFVLQLHVIWPSLCFSSMLVPQFVHQLPSTPRTTWSASSCRMTQCSNFLFKNHCPNRSKKFVTFFWLMKLLVKRMRWKDIAETQLNIQVLKLQKFSSLYLFLRSETFLKTW